MSTDSNLAGVQKELVRENLDFLRRRRIHLLAQPNKTKTERDEIAKIDALLAEAEENQQ